MTTLRKKISSSSIFGIGINSSIYIIGDVIAKTGAFLVIPIYVKYLSPSEYGVLGILLSLVALFNVLFSLQFGVAITVNYFNIDQELNRKKLISTIWYSILFISFGMFLLLYLIRKKIHIIIPDVTEELLLIAGGISLFSTFSIVPQVLMRLRKQAIQSTLLSTFLYLVGILSGLFFLLYFNLGVTGLLGGMLAGGLISAIVYIWVVRNDLGLYFTSLHFKNSLILSLPILLHMLAHWGLNLMDRFVLQLFVPLSDVGIYQLGYQMGTLLQIVLIAINGAWLPYFLENFDKPEKTKELIKVSRWIVFAQVWITLFFLLFIPYLLTSVFSNVYLSSINVFLWVIAGYFFIGFYHFWINIIFYYKKTTLVLIATASAFFVNLILNVILIPRYGYISAAISTMVSYMILALMAYLIAGRLNQFSFDYLSWTKAIVSGTILYGFAQVVSSIINADIGLIAGIISWIAYPIILWHVQFYTDDEKRWMIQFVENILR